MPFEGIPNGREELERGPSAAPLGRSAEREFVLEGKGTEYQLVQKQIIELETKMEQGNKTVETEPINSPKRQLAAAIGKELNRELDALRARKESLENDIKNAGGDPSHYTVQ